VGRILQAVLLGKHQQTMVFCERSTLKETEWMSRYKKVLYVCTLILLVQPSNDQTSVVMWLFSSKWWGNFSFPSATSHSFSIKFHEFFLNSQLKRPVRAFEAMKKREWFFCWFFNQKQIDIWDSDQWKHFQVLSRVTNFNLRETKELDKTKKKT
jgi:hypothetical protein